MNASRVTLRLSPGEFWPLPFPSDLLVTRSGEPSGIRTAWLLAISLFFVVPGPLSLGCRQLPCCCFFSFLSFAIFWQAALCYLVVLLPQRHTGFEHMLVLLVVTREWLLDFRAFLQVLHVFVFLLLHSVILWSCLRSVMLVSSICSSCWLWLGSGCVDPELFGSTAAL